MERIENWEKVEVKGINDFEGLKAGAYVCKIIDAREYTNENTGNKSLKVCVDICEGDYIDYFKKIYENNPNQDKKWDNNATKYLGLAESSLPFFKGFVTVVENSNAGYTWNWDEKTLKGKKVVGVFQPEEYTKQDGTTGVKIRLNSFRSIDKLDTIKVTKIKLLDGTFVDYSDYQEMKNQVKSVANDMFGSDIVTDELPFEI